jgi:short-subunit dehydrogenase
MFIPSSSQPFSKDSPMTHSPNILLTGATSGIGRDAALYLAGKGLRVVATGRSETRLAALREEAAGLPLDTLCLDVTDPASIDRAARAVDELTDQRGIDVLVNNAGYGEMGPMETISDARLRAQFDTNVFGLMAVTRAFLPAMRARGSGRIINVGSMGGTITMPLYGAYNATKYALESISDALRMELAAFGIYVSLIQPGPINTEFTPRSVATAQAAVHPAYAAAAASAARLEHMAARFGVSPAASTSRAIHRAATSRRPRARYATPRFAAWGVRLGRMLPTVWLDAVMRRSSGLTRKQLLPASSADTASADTADPAPRAS